MSPLGYVVGAVLVLIGGLAAYLGNLGDIGGDDTRHVVFDHLDEPMQQTIRCLVPLRHKPVLRQKRSRIVSVALTIRR